VKECRRQVQAVCDTPVEPLQIDIENPERLSTAAKDPATRSCASCHGTLGGT